MDPRALPKMPRLPEAKFQVPVLTVMRGKDYSTKLAGFEFEDDAGSSTMDRFVQEQLPEEVNELLLGFLKDDPVAEAAT